MASARAMHACNTNCEGLNRDTERVSARVQACLREGMRVFPPVPTLTREAERDMDLAGYKVPKGTMLGVAVFSMHNNPAYWQVHAQKDPLLSWRHRRHSQELPGSNAVHDIQAAWRPRGMFWNLCGLVWSICHLHCRGNGLTGASG